jgi:hypothetical protein
MPITNVKIEIAKPTVLNTINNARITASNTAKRILTLVLIFISNSKTRAVGREPFFPCVAHQRFVMCEH